MKSNRIGLPFAAAAVVCIVIALVWYALVKPTRVTFRVHPVQAISAAPSLLPSATPRPVVYIAPTPTASAPVPTAAASGTPAPAGTQTPQARPTTAPPLTAGTPPPLVQTIPNSATTLPPGAQLPPVLRRPPDAPPRILATSLSAPVVHGGDTVSGMVETSSNVASVEARVGGYGATMQKVGVGRFHLTYRIPNLPFFLHRTYMIQIIARNTRGQAVSTAVPITVR